MNLNIFPISDFNEQDAGVSISGDLSRVQLYLFKEGDEMKKHFLNHLRIITVAEDSVAYGSDLWGQHGISFFLEATNESSTQNIIFDVGQNYQALKHNMDVLGINVQKIDAIVLSHSHRDHTTGLVPLLQDVGKTNVPIIAHPDIFHSSFIIEPSLKYAGMRESKDLIGLNEGRFILTSDPLSILPGLSTSGEIPRRTDFEDPGLALYMIRNGKLVQDKVFDDMSLIANVRGKGIIILTGCSHAGVVNIVKQALTLFPGTPLEGIVGGFHLVDASRDKINKVLDALSEFHPQWISAGHCTGFEAQMALAEKFGSRFTPLHSGSIFDIQSQ